MSRLRLRGGAAGVWGGAAPPRCGRAGTGGKRERSDQQDEPYTLPPVPFRTRPGIANALAINAVVVAVRSLMPLLLLLCRCCGCLSHCQSFTTKTTAVVESPPRRCRCSLAQPPFRPLTTSGTWGPAARRDPRFQPARTVRRSEMNVAWRWEPNAFSKKQGNRPRAKVSRRRRRWSARQRRADNRRRPLRQPESDAANSQGSERARARERSATEQPSPARGERATAAIPSPPVAPLPYEPKRPAA